MSEKQIDCIIHGKPHTCPWGWKYRSWDTEDGPVMGWGCTQPGEVKFPEFVPQRIHDDRKKYLADQIQSHRGGELSKEFTELYPEKTSGMVKAGVITKDEVKKAKNVWKDLPNINNVHKTKTK